MIVRPTPLEGVLIIETEAFRDDRGSFMEVHHAGRYAEAGLDRAFVQDNFSFSLPDVLRGMHFQVRSPQAKLIQTLRGAIYDVVLDVRWGSPQFGQWTGVVLDEENHRQLFVPEGFAHGFCVISGPASVLYKCTSFFGPEDQGAVLWSDPDLAIDWPVTNPILSGKDKIHPRLKDIPPDRLPLYATWSKT